MARMPCSCMSICAQTLCMAFDMKKLFWILLIALVVWVAWKTGAPQTPPAEPASSSAVTAEIQPPFKMRGVWVASVFNIDYPSQPNLDVAQLKTQADQIISRVKQLGLNTIFLQVRPTGDALYPSRIFPVSGFLNTSGSLDGFDPLEYWVAQAHASQIQLHAWINPFRASTGPEQIDGEFLQTHGEYLRLHTDGKYYLDPGHPQTIKLICGGIAEILQNYPVDGVHFDDYFYPGQDFDDQQTFEAYRGEYTDKNAWRTSNINLLIRQAYETVKNESPEAVFGVSPFGIWANESQNPKGSATSGNQSLYSQYADSLFWIENKIIDYIAPQIYWEFGHPQADYQTLVDWWRGQTAGTGVELYIGLAAYKTDRPDLPAWQGPEQLMRQLDYNAGAGVEGVIFYNYKSICEKPDLFDQIGQFFEKTAS